MKRLSNSLTGIEKLVTYTMIFGGLSIFYSVPFLYKEKFNTDLLLLYYGILIIFTIIILGLISLLKDIYFDNKYFHVSVKSKNVIVPINNIKKITSISFFCNVIYKDNKKLKSLWFIINPRTFFEFYFKNIAELKIAVAKSNKK